MQDYLMKHVGKRIMIIREGFPKEASLTGTLERLENQVAILIDDDNNEWMIPLSKILAVGPPEGGDSKTVGFM